MYNLECQDTKLNIEILTGKICVNRVVLNLGFLLDS